MNKFYYIFLVTLLSLFSCGEEDPTEVPVDLADDRPQVAKDTIFVSIKGTKAGYVKGSKATIYLTDTVITIDVGDFSTASGIIELPVPETQVLPKLVTEKIKVEFRGKSFDEFGNGTEFIEIPLVAYVDDGDTIQVRSNPIHHMISILHESGMSYETATDSVLKDWNLPDSMDFNVSWDDPNTDPAVGGKILAVSGLLSAMRYTHELSDWDVIPYSTFKEQLPKIAQVYMHICKALGNCTEDDVMRDSVDVYNDDLQKYHNQFCIEPQNKIDNLVAEEYRNIHLYGISDETVAECKSYITDWYLRLRPEAETYVIH